MSLFPIPSAASTNLLMIIFSPVSFNEPNSNIEVTLKSPALFNEIPVEFPDPSVNSFKVAVIAALSIVFIKPW